MCIAIHSVDDFDGPVDVQWRKRPHLKRHFQRNREDVVAVMRHDECWIAGGIRWGCSVEINGGKKTLLHAQWEKSTQWYWSKWFPILLPIDGFVERNTKGSSPRFIQAKTEGPCWIPALWSNDLNDEPGAVIITQPAPDPMAAYHHRIPICCTFEGASKWLSDRRTLPLSQGIAIEAIETF